jgi:hypothetical protein
MQRPFFWITMVATLALGGCGIAAKVDARNEYQVSSERYKACLAANPTDARLCDGFRLAMEADERKYTNFSAGIQQGGSAAVNVNSLSR